MTSMYCWFRLSSICLSILVVGVLTATSVRAEKFTVYVGTYTGAKSKGIYAFEFDSKTGKAGEPRLVATTPSPSFLALNPTQPVIYAVNELDEFNGEKGGAISAFKIGGDGRLTLLNQVSTVGSGPCHVSVDSQGRAVLAANYGSGSVISYRLDPDGRIGQRGSFIQHTGSSVNKQRQEGPHAHGVFFSAGDRFVYAPDLGQDKVMIYDFHPDTAELTPNDPPAGIIPPGSGPRHLAQHPTQPLAWVVNEMASTVTTLHVDKANGALTAGPSVSTLPAGFKGNSSCAEIFVHPNGKFLYASNRGHNSITVFKINESTGGLKAIQHELTDGKIPRSFAIDPTGHWLLAAGQDSDDVNIFKLHPKTGRLTHVAGKVEVPAPVCLVFRRR